MAQSAHSAVDVDERARTIERVGYRSQHGNACGACQACGIVCGGAPGQAFLEERARPVSACMNLLPSIPQKSRHF